MARKSDPLEVSGVPVEVPTSAQGFRVITRSNGERQAYWVATKAALAKGYKTRTIRLHGNLDNMLDVEKLFRLCNVYQREMIDWLDKGDRRKEIEYFGTVSSLIYCWQNDPLSTFRENRFSTQETDRNWAKVVESVGGHRLVSSLTGSDLREWFRKMREPAKPGQPPRERRATGGMDTFRTAISYGCEAGLPDCLALATVLQRMIFRKDRSESVVFIAKPKKVAMGFEHAEAIVKKGLEIGARGLPVALGVAAQFEFTLRQIDVIGYWLPCSRIVIEPGMLVFGNNAWKPGIRFEDFASGTLDLSTTKNETDAVFDVTEYPLFQMALAAVSESERTGPLVSFNGQPIRKRFYRDLYREVADAAGVPANIWNARARHGGISEGQSSGADIVDVSKHAQHTDIATTVRSYVVSDVETTRRVAKARVATRKTRTDSE